MIQGIEKVLDMRCGKEVSEKVMGGGPSKDLSKIDTAMWVKGAMERLDALADPALRCAVMEECGRNCCAINKGVVVTFKKRKASCGSLDAFLENEMKHPVRGTRVSQKGGAIHFFYTPREFGKGMRCYCSLVSSLPANQMISKAYCSCSVGFVKALWEQLLERPVRVDLVRSALMGSDECEFRIEAQG